MYYKRRVYILRPNHSDILFWLHLRIWRSVLLSFLHTTHYFVLPANFLINIKLIHVSILRGRIPSLIWARKDGQDLRNINFCIEWVLQKLQCQFFQNIFNFKHFQLCIWSNLFKTYWCSIYGSHLWNVWGKDFYSCCVC